MKREIADLYLKNRKKLEDVEATTQEAFASKVLEIMAHEETQFEPSHDMEVLKRSMKHLRNDSSKLKGLEVGSDEYDFSRNECRNLINSLKSWLTIEGLLP